MQISDMEKYLNHYSYRQKDNNFKTDLESVTCSKLLNSWEKEQLTTTNVFM